MRASLRLERRASYADYLAVEQTSEHRHELIDGVIVATAGGSDEHNAIAGKLGGLVVMRVQAPCRYYTPDQRFWIPAAGRARYADGSIICGPPEHPAHDGQATVNPTVVIEVLSPSREGDDEGDKRLDLQSLPTLRAYVVVSQDERRVKVYRRGEDGVWPEEAEVHTGGRSFSLPTLASACSVDELYDTILDEQGRSLLR